MTFLDVPSYADNSLFSLKRRLRDYARVGVELFWQRFVIYAAATILAATYYDFWVAVICYAGVWISEIYDLTVFRRILRWRDNRDANPRRLVWEIYFGTMLSAAVVCFFTVTIAVQQGQTTHFMPLFMIFSAAVFATMNNHQFLSVLTLRLSIYVATILFIVVRDLVIARPPLNSELWLQFFTTLFVLGFIFECARNFLKFYRIKLAQFNALEKEHEKTKIAYKAKTEFLSIVSHELRTPLTSIKGALDLVNSGSLGKVPPTIGPVLLVAQRNSQRLAMLINDLLDLQKIDSGKMQFDFRPMQLSQIAEESVEEIRPYAEGFGVSLNYRRPEMDTTIRGDRERLKQVIVNLLSNASKFSNRGDEVEIWFEDRDGRLRLSVRDHGIGLPEGSYVKVFEEFTQMDSTDQRKAGGTGLGMNISKKIVESHNGEIDFVSEVGKGSTFFIELGRADGSTTTEPLVAAA